MFILPSWKAGVSVPIAESKGGVLVTTHPSDNLVDSVRGWPAPELLQKACASSLFQGKTPQDTNAAKSGLGHYCDLQSLNSEDAVTWSFFGSLIYAPAETRLVTLNRILESVGAQTVGDAPITWLWRRLPHPEKPESSGGPEIDFAFLCETILVLGEAKWNSGPSQGPGIQGNRDQLYLRAKYCDTLARTALPAVTSFVILGVGRSATVFQGSEVSLETDAIVAQLSWEQVRECFPVELASELHDYLAWKGEHSTCGLARILLRALLIGSGSRARSQLTTLCNIMCVTLHNTV